MSIMIEGATKRFAGRAAVDGLCVDVPTGAFFVVLGASGCGKSSLLRLIAGLETLDAGEISLDARRVAGRGLHLAPEARGVGVVFQSYALWPHMTVAENVAFPIAATGGSRAQARAGAQAHLKVVELTDHADRKPADLSGGQRQRVALARCLASRARTILMDEPLANLDPHLRSTMEQELADFHRRAGVTTLFITHDQREAMALADRVAVMRAGRFEQVAPPETIYARPATETVARFIGRSAVMDARVLAVSGASARVAVAGVEVTVNCPQPTAAGAARLVMRPENVALDAEGTSATVQQVTYRGGHWEAEVALPGLAEALPMTLAARVERGAPVRIALRGGWVLPPA